MKKAKFVLILWCLCAAIGFTAAEGFFTLPESIASVESEAFSSLSYDSVFIPKSTVSIGDDAFGEQVKNIYGYRGSEAEIYALKAGKAFYPVDIIDLRLLDGDLWAVQGDDFEATLSAETNIGSLSYSIRIEKSGASYAFSENDTGSFNLNISESGIYDVTIGAANGYAELEKTYASALTVEPQIGFASGEIIIDKGQTKALFEGEERSVEVLAYDKTIISYENGQITGLKTGKTTLEAQIKLSSGKTVKGSCVINVVKPVTSVSISGGSKHMLPGEEASLAVTIKPTDAGQKQLVWNSSDESIASVDENGLVSSIAPGKAVITAKAVSGASASLEISVEKPVSEVILPSEISVAVGGSEQINASLLPEDSYIKELTWTSSDTSIATVSGGKVKGIKQGECEITAVSHNGIAASCTVKVVKPVTSIKLSNTALTLDLFADFTLTAETSPSDATDPTLTWTSSDESIATVDEDGVIHALRGGVCTITATAIGGKNAVCKITVKETKPTSVSFNDLFVTLRIGDEYQSGSTVLPVAAQNKKLKYSSDNESVVSVDENGVFHAISSGSAIITAVSDSVSGVSCKCKVFVLSDDALPLEGVVVGINPGHQNKQIWTKYPISPGSSTLAYGCKVGTAGVNTKTPEYVVALDVSLMLRDILVQNGATVIMTRTSNDAYLTNIERADILNTANVDAAIQVHCNGGGASMYGMSSYYRTTGSWVNESKWLATCMQTGMLASTGAKDKGVHICNTYMSLNYSYTPACLIEMGYLTNPQEELLLIDPSYQLKLAQGIYEGLLLYFGR